MSSTAIKNRTEQKFMPIYLESIRVDSVLDFDLYINVNNQLVLYRSANLAFTERTLRKLLDNRIDRLYVAFENKKSTSDISRRIWTRFWPTRRSVKRRRPASCTTRRPTWSRTFSTTRPTARTSSVPRNWSGQTVNFILQGRDAFLNLLKITSFDYYTYTHSVNVCTFSIALAQQLGFSDEEFLHELGIGSLLHDVGKSRISDRILNKRGSLTPIEFEIMKKHPKWGVEILDETDLIETSSHFPILQHHERGDRRGYPSGLSLDEMHIYSKIVAIADSFDAMTTDRVYQKAIDTFPALKIMFSLKGAYDEQILRAFVELMGPSGLAEL